MISKFIHKLYYLYSDQLLMTMSSVLILQNAWINALARRALVINGIFRSMAARRGERPGLWWSEKKEKTEEFRTPPAELGLGLENRLTAHVGLLSGGQRQAVTLLMATLRRPELLLLDEHTAALDPKTAAKVLDMTERIVTAKKLTTLMITHNMKDAIAHSNRLIMMNEGHIILDIAGEEKKKLTKKDLLDRFAALAGQQEETDAVLLS